MTRAHTPKTHQMTCVTSRGHRVGRGLLVLTQEAGRRPESADDLNPRQIATRRSPCFNSGLREEDAMTTTKRIHRELASPAEIAALFRLDIKTVRRRIADGTLPAFRVGRQIRIDVASAEAALMRPMNAAAVAMIRAEAGRRTS